MEAEERADTAPPAKKPAGNGPKPAPEIMSQTMKWVGYLTALIGLGGSLAAGIHWYQQRQQHKAEFASRMAASQALLSDGDYKASVESYNSILKEDPLNRTALDAQVKAVMLWDENYGVVTRAGQNAAEIAGPELDTILNILNAGLARSTGNQAADLQAHIGWAHWLKQHIAEQEFGSAAQDNLLAALKADPANVYAHAMLGNYMLMTGQDLQAAASHFKLALATGRERQLVRRLQLGGLLGRDQTTGARAEIMRATNEMRKADEPISDRARISAIEVCLYPPYTSAEDLRESLTSLPREDTWQTYLWLDKVPKEGSYREAQLFARSYIEASLDEVTGEKALALSKYQALKAAIKGKSSSLEGPVDEAIKRLSHT